MYWTWEIRQKVTESVKVFLNLIKILMIQKLIGFKMYFKTSIRLERKHWRAIGLIYFKCKRPHIHLTAYMWGYTNFKIEGAKYLLVTHRTLQSGLFWRMFWRPEKRRMSERQSINLVIVIILYECNVMLFQ